MIPPDRGHVSTEKRHPGSAALDALDTPACIELLARDQHVAVDAVLAARRELAAFIDALVERVRAGGRLISIGAGTSGRLGVLDASECPPTFNAEPAQVVGIIAGGDASLRRSSEGMEDDPNGASAALEELALSPRDSLLGIAAGGTTPYVLGALDIARAKGSLTALITCSPRPRPASCDHLIVLNTGAELLTGSTRLKAGTATKIALNAITTSMFVRLGKTYGNLMVDLRATNDKLTDRAIRILQQIAPELAREDAWRLLRDAGGQVKSAIVMARLGVDRATAQHILDEHQGVLRAVIGPPA